MRSCLCTIVCTLAFMPAVRVANGQTPPPATQPTAFQLITNDLRFGDAAKIDAALAAIRKQNATGHIPDALWKNWLPQLIRLKRYSDVAEITQSASKLTPFAGAAGPFMSFQAQALLALNKPAEALAAAKSYYNVCDMKDTAMAVKVVSDCLTAARPEDPGIAKRFQDEQAAASGGTPTAGAGLLESVTIDAKAYDEAIAKWAKQAKKFSDRVSYANLLLIAGRGDDAEAVFRKLYQSAKTQAELATATEGLARSLRAEDGNMARANAWLLSLQQAK